MRIPLEVCLHGHPLIGQCDACDTGEALDEIRRRLQALEQNTTPARPAEQKPREYWVIDGRAYAKHLGSDVYGAPADNVIHVREVL